MTENKFWAEALAPVTPKEEPDLSDMPLAEFGEFRKDRIKNTSDVRGVDADNPVERGRSIAQLFLPRETRPLQHHALDRIQHGIRDACDVFQAERPNPRSHKSPYRM